MLYERYDEKYFFDLRQLSDNYHQEDSLESVHSVEAAVYRVQLNPHQLSKIVERVIDEKVHGGAKAYHKLIEACKECGDYEDALKLCKLALRRIDSLLLYTDIIEISIHFENPIRYCGNYLRKVLHSDRKHWDLRLFSAVYELFYTLVANALVSGVNYEYYENARAAAIGMQSFYGVEDGYYAESQLLILLGKRDEARSRLEQVIFNRYDPEKDSSRDLECPKCCRLWITEFKDFYGDRRMTNYVVTKGLNESGSKEDELFFAWHKERLARQLTHGGESVKAEEMLGKIKSDFSIDTYNDETTLRKEENNNG